MVLGLGVDGDGQQVNESDVVEIVNGAHAGEIGTARSYPDVGMIAVWQEATRKSYLVRPQALRVLESAPQVLHQ